MTISVVHSRSAGQSHASAQAVASIVQAAERGGVDIRVHDLMDFSDLSAFVETLGEVVIFRWATAVHRPSQRVSVLEAIRSKRIVLNAAILDHPRIRFKDYQQQAVAKAGGVLTIPTYHFTSEKEFDEVARRGKLTFPAIQKPNGGVQGKDVFYLERADDVQDLPRLRRYIFQPFIANQGDFRVVMVGGEMLGAMKRIRSEGKVANNISQGGQGVPERDSTTLAALRTVASRICQVFPLDVAGIDIMHNTQDQQFYFLEVNVSPQWQEFERVTGVDVGGTIVRWCQTLHGRRYET